MFTRPMFVSYISYIIKLSYITYFLIYKAFQKDIKTAKSLIG